jgi:pimeloyl-ACP methyl ester carboxylesterase
MADVAISSDGMPIAYEAHGAGEPTFVFVHGWSCDRSYWREQISCFAQRHRVVAVDLAGHGESGLGRTEWTMSAFGEDVAAVARQLALRDVVLIGHSMGGDVVVEAALRLRDTVRAVIWVDTYRSLDEEVPDDEIDAFVAPFRADFPAAARDFARRLFLPHSDPDLVEWVSADMAAAPQEVALACIRSSVANAGVMPARLRELGLPVVAVNPDNGPSDIDGLARHAVRTVQMRGLGHFPMLEDAAAFNAVLAEIVRPPGDPS